MANEFTARNGLIAQKDSVITGSLIVTSGITGSLLGTASYAAQALTASYASAYAAVFPYTGSAIISGSLEVPQVSGLNTSGGSLVILSTNNATKGTIDIGNNNAESVYLVNRQFQFTNVVLNAASNGNGFSITRVTPTDTLPNYVTNRADTTTGIGGTINTLSLITSGSTRLKASSAGNILIGTTTDAGYRLDVSGSTRLNGNSIITGSLTQTTTVTAASSNAVGATLLPILSSSANNDYLVALDVKPSFYSASFTGTKATAIRIAGNLIPSGGYTYNLGDSANMFATVNTVNVVSQANLGLLAAQSTYIGSGNTYRIGIFQSTGNVTIGNTMTDAGYKLDVQGTGRFTSNVGITGSLTTTGAVTAGGQGYFAQGVWANTLFNLQGAEIFRVTYTTKNLLLGATVDSGYRLDVSGSTRIRGYANTSISSSLLVYGSGSTNPVFTVQGSQGELFSVTDSLSGSLFSVNDISGLPVLEAFSDNTVLLGSYQAPALLTTNKVVLTASGNFTLSSLPTSSYDGAFYDYTARSGSNARAGTIMAMWSGTAVNFTETTTLDFGSTTGLSLGVFVSGANMVLTGSASTTAWTIKTIIRSI